MSAIVAENTHWYAQDGSPAYEVPARDKRQKCPACGGSRVGAAAKAATAACRVCDAEGYVYPFMRPTTLRDARPLGLCRSITGIIRQMAAPGLVRYGIRQFAQSAWTAPEAIRSLDYEAWFAAVDADAKEHARVAAERGTAIHAACERRARGEDAGELAPWADALDAALREAGVVDEWEPEKSLVSEFWGFGGKLDLLGQRYIVDIKTKDFGAEPPTLYDEHSLQLAAQGELVTSGDLGSRRYGIAFLDRKTPRCVFAPVSQSQVERGWRLFKACLVLQREVDGYWPPWAEWQGE